MVLLQNWPFFHLFILGNIGNKNVLYDILKGKKAFLGYNETFRTLKKGDFSKRVSQRFWSKIGQFSILVFQVIQVRKMCLTILQNEKTPFQGIKTRSSKSRKTEIFAKGLVHGFGLKLAIFLFLILDNISQENVFYDILERKKRLSRLYKQEVEKLEKLRFLQKGWSIVLVQNCPFFHLFILGNICQGNVFYNILKGKKRLCRV